MAKKPKFALLASSSFVAVRELTGGTKDGPHVTEAGVTIDEAEAEKLGLDDEQLQQLADRGDIRHQAAAAAASTAADFDGIARADLVATLNAAAGLDLPASASVENALTAALDHGVPEDGTILHLDELRDFLAEKGVQHGDGDKPEQLLEHLLAHGQAETFDVEAAAKAIDKELNADEVKAELALRKVPFETDANKPVLCRLLAQVRHAEPELPAADQTLV